MSKKMLLTIDGNHKKVKQPMLTVDGVHKKVLKAFLTVNGLHKLVFQNGTPLTDLSIGSSVFLNESGVPVEYLIVHQGKPSDMYDGSCDGTWLLRKDIYILNRWDDNDNNYGTSIIHTYLNETFLGLFDTKTQSKIIQAKIPYVNGTKNSPVASGADGLSTKVFLLSGKEVGFNVNYFPADGVKLDYFELGDTSGGTNRRKRIAYHNGTATNWWLRSPHTNSKDSPWYVAPSGANSSAIYYCGYGIRPALILPKTTVVDDNFNVIV